MKLRHQTTCVECLKEIWISKHDAPATHCPECGAKLPEQSSEDEIKIDRCRRTK